VGMQFRADSLDWAAGILAGAGCSFRVVAPEELRGALRELAARLSEAA